MLDHRALSYERAFLIIHTFILHCLPLEGKVGNLPIMVNWSDEVEAFPQNQYPYDCGSLVISAPWVKYK